MNGTQTVLRMLMEENVLLVSDSGLQTSAPPGRWEEIRQSPGV